MVSPKEKMRFLDRDPVPPSLRGKEAKIEQLAQRAAIVLVGGIRRHVPKNWLTLQGSDTLPAPAVDQGSPVPAALVQSADLDAEGDDDPITERAWYGILETCLELNFSQEEAYQVIAETVGVQPDELDPSRLTWQQYLQIIERLEQLESTP